MRLWKRGLNLEESVITNEISIDDRRKKILELLDKTGKVKVSELSRIFNISEVTIRLDLTELEKGNLLERIHGGAVSTNKAYYNLNFDERIKKYEDEKREIAKAAASLVEDHDTILINSGTTTFFIAQELKRLKSLTVVTNSLIVAQELAQIQNFNVILLGGNFNNQYQFTYGDDAVRQIQKYKTDKLILSVDGVSADFGLTTHHHQEAEVNRMMMERVNQVVIVADYSKIGRENFATISSLENVDMLITNSNANADELNNIKTKGIHVVTV